MKLCWARPPSHQQRTSPRIIFGIIIYAEKSRPSFRSRCHAAGPGPGRSVPGCSYSLCSVSGDLSGVPFHLDSYNLRNFVRHYLWIITSVFSCTFCTFILCAKSPNASMRRHASALLRSSILQGNSKHTTRLCRYAKNKFAHRRIFCYSKNNDRSTN